MECTKALNRTAATAELVAAHIRRRSAIGRRSAVRIIWLRPDGGAALLSGSRAPLLGSAPQERHRLLYREETRTLVGNDRAA